MSCPQLRRAQRPDRAQAPAGIQTPTHESSAAHTCRPGGRAPGRSQSAQARAFAQHVPGTLASPRRTLPGRSRAGSE